MVMELARRNETLPDRNDWQTMLDEAAVRRFWSQVDQSGECWMWIGARNQRGYGQFGLRGRNFRVPRIAWTIYHGAWPGPLFVLHHCDMPPCVRPDHLFLGTGRDKMADARRKGRLLTGDNHPLRRRPECAARGERNGNVSLTQEIVDRLRAAAPLAPSISALARDFALNRSTVSQAVRGTTWKTVR